MKKLILSGLVVAAMLVGVRTVSAHHSFAAEFDRNKPIKLEGVVTKVEWTNPHVWVYVNVKGADGKVVNWGAEFGPPHGLQNSGWRRDTLKIGDVVTLNGSMAKNGTNRMNASTVTLAGTGARPGTTLDAASSGKEAAKDGK